MKIGLFTDQYLPNISGMVTSLINIRQGLEAEGHEVYIVAPAHKDASDNDSHLIRVFSVDPRVFIGNPFAIPTRGIVKKLVDMKFDVIHVQEMFSIGALGHTVAKKSGSALVLSVHTQWDMLYKHYPKAVVAAAIGTGFAYPLYFGLRNTLPIYLGEHGGETSFISKQFGRNLVIFANECDAVISPSAHVMAKLEKFRCKSPIYHIPNAINLNAQVPEVQLPHHDPESVVFMCVGRVSYEKRQHALIEAFARVVKRYNAQLYIVGDGPDLERCMELAEKKGLEGKVVFTGSVDNAVARGLLLKADTMVLASHNFDNQPMVILEALLSGTPIMYCDPALKDGLNDNNSLLTPHSIAGLARGMSILASSQQLRQKMSKESKKIAKSYSTEHITRQVLAVYARALESKH